jgi:flavorubredoxin
MKDVKLADGIYWVGAIDWDIRFCGSYTTPIGTTYNAYLILDEKNVLIDTVKTGFHSELLERIRNIIDPSEIDYVIVNHTEKDHAGALLEVMRESKDAEIVISDKGKESLLKYYGAWPARAVDTGDALKIGERTLTFIKAQMLHWPDNMCTYSEKEGILFSNDPFGQHIASSERFDDEIPSEKLMEHAARYFAAIVMPYSAVVLKKIGEIKNMGIRINAIAPAHGLIWRKAPEKIIEAYAKWASGEAENKAVIIYDTMWSSTAEMAKLISRGMEKNNIQVRLFNLRNSDWTEIAKEVMESKAVLVGSPALNSGMYPTVAGFLHYIRGLRPRNKMWFAFSSYGWGGGAVKAIKEELSRGRFQVIDTLEVKYAPGKKDIEECYRFGEDIAAMIRGEDK